MEIIVIIAILLVYFFPYIVAAMTKSKYSTAILALNFFLGWTVLGWIGAIIWAAIPAKETN